MILTMAKMFLPLVQLPGSGMTEGFFCIGDKKKRISYIFNENNTSS